MSGAPSNPRPFHRPLTKVTFAKMKLPHHFLESPFFLFQYEEDFIKALGDSISPAEHQEIARLLAADLPPVLTRTSLATMFGINPGLIWSFVSRPGKYYRTFAIPKGKNGGIRVIHAPRVALKIIQKWIAVQLDKAFSPTSHVFGFVSGRSHVGAAAEHCNARWVYSCDILDFFQSTPVSLVETALQKIGFGKESAALLSRLSCLNGALAQGSPASPVLSNICFQDVDIALREIAAKYGSRLTRYADDIVFSGEGEVPEGLANDVANLFLTTPWKLSAKKTELAIYPRRLKVHGLLVQGEKIRLTKGYRNKLRAYTHLLQKDCIKEEDLAVVRGHIRYGEFVHQHSDQSVVPIIDK